ncbi:MAG: hypothetical protein Q9181_007453 [Wetmoreana brouardii]
MAPTLEERLAAQLQLEPNAKKTVDTVRATTSPTTLAEIPLSRLAELLPHNVQVRAYLKENDGTFRELDKLRERGWGTSEGDTHFKNQREAADNKDERQEGIFQDLHKKIGNEMRVVGAFNLNCNDSSNIKTLNLCMAPGAYTAVILEQYPDAFVGGITLPIESGGHKMVIPHGSLDPRVDVRFMDITMLLSEMYDESYNIPPMHPDAQNFITSSPFSGQTFDLVLCDGQALRTHRRADYRETCEPTRLLAMQLVFGMTRIKPGGSFIILLHKADAYDTVKLLKSFCSFAKVTLFKPKAAHRQRSTFYMIAKDVQSASTAARCFIEDMKQAWIRATFGGAEGTGINAESPKEAEVDALLQDFGPSLMRMAQEIWSIQVQALSQSRWLPGSSKSPLSPALQSTSSSNAAAPRPPTINLAMRAALGNLPWALRATDELRSPSSPLTPAKENRPRQGSRGDISEEKQKKMAGSWSPSSLLPPAKENRPRQGSRADISEEKQKKMAGSWR